MAKKSKKDPQAAAVEDTPPAPPVPAKSRRKKKGVDAAPPPDETPLEAEAPVIEEQPASRKRKKKKGAEEPAPAESASESGTDSVPDVSNETPPAEEPVPESVEPVEPVAETPAADTPSDIPAETAAPAPVNWDELARTVEALLFAAEEPLQARELARCSGTDSPTIRKLIPKIRERYDAERRPWDIAETGTGWRLVTRPEFYPAIQRLKTQTLQRKLTQAGLETLALIAYRQPISRAEIENVRGVGAGPVLRQLLERKLIKIAGRGTGLGQPLLYGTTDFFLEHFGLKTLADLPKPGEFKQ